jgi:hypothetical protein
MDTLKNYHDDDTKREWYMAQIGHSAIESFVQLRTITMELEMLAYQSKLTPEQIEKNRAQS